MKYLLFALINALYGFMLLFSVTKDTPGIGLILFIGGTLSILGVIGFGLWIWQTVSSVKGKNAKADNSLASWWQIVRGIDILLILGLLFRFFVLQPYIIEGPSMETNFYDNEYILVNQMTYRIHPPERGDVIVFKYPKDPSEDYIKRIIGLPGETVEIKNGSVYINGNKMNEGYLKPNETTIVQADKEATLETVLGNDEYFVLGDNRYHSSDSRDWGILPKKNIIGKAWFAIYPFKYKGLIKDHNFSFN